MRSFKTGKVSRYLTKVKKRGLAVDKNKIDHLAAATELGPREGKNTYHHKSREVEAAHLGEKEIKGPFTCKGRKAKGGGKPQEEKAGKRKNSRPHQGGGKAPHQQKKEQTMTSTGGTSGKGKGGNLNQDPPPQKKEDKRRRDPCLNEGQTANCKKKGRRGVQHGKNGGGSTKKEKW